MPLLYMFSRSIIEDSRSINDTSSHQKVTPQFGASLTDHSIVIIYNRNMFIIAGHRLVLDGELVNVLLLYLNRQRQHRFRKRSK
jgi:hypothetical protein